MKSLTLKKPNSKTPVTNLQRRAALERYTLFKKKLGGAKAAAKAGASVPTLWRWQKQFDAHGIAGLGAKYANCGRRSPFAKIRLTAKAVRSLEALTVETGSARAAWLHLATTPACPPALAARLRRGGSVPAMLGHLGRVKPVPALCYTSLDGRRLFVRLPFKGTVTSRLHIPAATKGKA